MKWLTRSIGLALVAGTVGILATAYVGRTEGQDPSAPATYGEVTLRCGFTPDPHRVELTAGGPIQTRLGGVDAWVARAPDYRLNYTACEGVPLTIYALSSADTTLLVNLPNGTWVANDDGGGNLNPLLRFANPQSGQYDIWVGTFSRDDYPRATLHITELR